MNDTPDAAIASAADLPAGEVSADLGSTIEESWYQRHESFVLGGGFIVLFLLFWEAVPYIFTLSKGLQLFFTTPSKIFLVIWTLFADGTIWPQLHFSGTTFALGLVLGVIVGLPLGVALGRSEILNSVFDPFITAFNATPRLVFLPLVLLWFGIGMWSTVLIVFIGAVFPLLINTYAGVKNADKLLINVVRSFGASEWEINKLVVVPNSLPFIIAGLRLAIGRAVLGVVVAEFFGGSEAGIGVMMVNASGKYQVDVVFAGLLIFMALSLIMTTIVKLLETRLSRWRPQKVKTF